MELSPEGSGAVPCRWRIGPVWSLCHFPRQRMVRTGDEWWLRMMVILAWWFDNPAIIRVQNNHNSIKLVMVNNCESTIGFTVWYPFLSDAKWDRQMGIVSCLIHVGPVAPVGAPAVGHWFVPAMLSIAVHCWWTWLFFGGDCDSLTIDSGGC